MRGFTEISLLWDLSQKYHSMILGGYARYCLSQNSTPFFALDVDLFPQSNGDSLGLVEALKSLGFKVKHENEISFSFAKREDHENPYWRICPNIQVIKPVIEGAIVTVGKMEDVLDNFDFSITRCGLLSPTQGLAGEEFLVDESSHHLILKNIHCPISSLHRCIKYSKKGYFLPLAETVKLFLDWDERTPEYKDKLIEMIGKMKGVDGVEPKKEDIEELEKLMHVD